MHGQMHPSHWTNDLGLRAVEGVNCGFSDIMYIHHDITSYIHSDEANRYRQQGAIQIWHAQIQTNIRQHDHGTRTIDMDQ